MPHSLRVRLRNLKHKGELTEKDVDRLITALDYYEDTFGEDIWDDDDSKEEEK